MARITSPIDAEIAATRSTIAAQGRAIRYESPKALLADAKRQLKALEGRRRRERALELALAADPNYVERLEVFEAAATAAEEAYDRLLAQEAQKASSTMGGRTWSWIDMDRLGLDVQIADRERLRARTAFRNLKAWPDRLLAQADTRIITKTAPDPESEPSFSIPFFGRQRRERQARRDGAA